VEQVFNLFDSDEQVKNLFHFLPPMAIRPVFLTVFLIWSSLIIGQLLFIFVLTTNASEPKALTFGVRHFMLGGFAKGKVSIDTLPGQSFFLIGNVIVFALSESIGVLGFVNGLGSPGKDAWLPFIGGSILLLLFHIPLPSRFTPAKRHA
jgi:hypothetical protein